jgi:hypothetical protein
MKQESLYTVDGNINYTSLWEAVLKTKKGTAIQSSDNTEQHYSQWPSCRNSPDVLQLMNGLRQCG